jgi:hypothetical protein
VSDAPEREPECGRAVLRDRILVEAIYFGDDASAGDLQTTIINALTLDYPNVAFALDCLRSEELAEARQGDAGTSVSEPGGVAPHNPKESR